MPVVFVRPWTVHDRVELARDAGEDVAQRPTAAARAVEKFSPETLVYESGPHVVDSLRTLSS